MPDTETTTRLRLNLISEIALTESGAARPIHILRTGTFTGQSGIPVTFEADDLRAIATNFAAGKRKKPPITERHDWGRAIGRMLNVYTDQAGDNLYALPKWSKEGQQLLADDTYDGFSVELDAGDGGYILIGGSLTNYPAVDGLEPVTLSAPPIEAQDPLPLAPPALAGARADTAPTPQPTTEVTHMSDTPLEQASPSSAPTTNGTAPPMAELSLPPISDPALQARLDAYFAQHQAALAQREREIEARMRSDFERAALEADQRNAIYAFARARTITSADQPYAIPGTAEELNKLLLETPAAVRGKWQTLLTRITTGGLVSFDEIGSSGEAAEASDRWSILLNAKVAGGMSRVDAIRAVAKEHPDLYAAQSAPAKRGGR